jgi:hypothetical protein
LPSSEQGLFSSPELLFVPADVPELLDFTEELLLESVDELDFAELLLDPFDSADAPLRVTLEEEDSSSMLLDDSSSRGAKLLSSSPHATKKNAKASAKM